MGVENFVKVLGIGVVLFIIALFVSNSDNISMSFSGSDSYDYDDVYKGISKVVIFSDEIGSIGTVKEAYRTINLGPASVGHVLTDRTIKEKDELFIENGVFKKNSESITFSAHQGKRAEISFVVNDSNYYGTLNIMLNGELIYSNYTYPQEFKIVTFDLKEGENKIDIYASSSGLKFWAPTTYHLLDFKLKIKDYETTKVEKYFQLNDYEINGFRKGILAFNVAESEINSDLNVEVNDKPLYKARPLPTSQPIESEIYRAKHSLKPGENKITFFTDSGDSSSYYDIDTILLRIFFYASDEYLEGIRTFDVSQRKMRFFDNANYTGRIIIDISDVLLDNGITLTLNDKTFHSRKVGSPGKIIYEFNKEDLKLKDNVLRLQTDGAYNIDKISLIIEKV